MMKLTLALTVAAACAVAFGFYRGWFGMSASRAGLFGGGKRSVGLTVDSDKAQEDLHKVKAAAADLRK